MLLPLFFLGLSLSSQQLYSNPTKESNLQTEQELLYQIKAQQFQNQLTTVRFEINSIVKSVSFPKLLPLIKAVSELDLIHQFSTPFLQLKWCKIVWHSTAKIKNCLYPFHFFS